MECCASIEEVAKVLGVDEKLVLRKCLASSSVLKHGKLCPAKRFMVYIGSLDQYGRILLDDIVKVLRESDSAKTARRKLAELTGFDFGPCMSYLKLDRNKLIITAGRLDPKKRTIYIGSGKKLKIGLVLNDVHWDRIERLLELGAKLGSTFHIKFPRKYRGAEVFVALIPPEDKLICCAGNIARYCDKPIVIKQC